MNALLLTRKETSVFLKTVRILKKIKRSQTDQARRQYLQDIYSGLENLVRVSREFTGYRK